MTKVAIFDYGAGNLYSLKSAFERNGAESVSIIYDLHNLNFDGIVLPGVGNFDPAIKSILDDIEKLKQEIKKKIPLLGICLGMEMLFNSSEEGILPGLSIFEGEVVALPKGRVKVPHMGWNNLKIVKESRLLKGVNNKSWVYFIHSYHVKPYETEIISAETEYESNIVAVIERENIFGTQFHPEKSGETGSKMIKNFLNICEERR